MSATARLSAIVPVLDDAERLRRLLAELRGDPHLEVVVVDGGSRDETPVAASAAHRVLAAPSSRGGQLRAGVAASERDWLWFLHADTQLEASAIRTLAGHLDAPGWGFFAVRLDNRAWPYRVIEQAMKWRSFATGIATGDQGIFVHRRLLDAVGGVPDQPLMEDVELSIRPAPDCETTAAGCGDHHLLPTMGAPRRPTHHGAHVDAAIALLRRRESGGVGAFV